jgi:prepilin-type N-terminal cleavage/methylation domain-containing protein
MTFKTAEDKTGFTLVEILIVLAILGIIMGAVYSIYLTHQKSAYTQEEVVEVQQNLRIAMDAITRDVRMAGMLVPVTIPPLAAASAANSISINTASALGVYAMIDGDPSFSSSTVTCPVESEEAVDAFAANLDQKVRILRPLDCSQPVATEFTFHNPTDADRTNKQLILEQAGTFTGSETIKRGDMIVMTPTDPATGSDSVVYALVNGGTVVNGVTCPQNQQCIKRDIIANGSSNPDIIASNISGLNFGYILDDGTETNAPATTDLPNIRSVRVTITGQTSSTSLLSGGAKTRQLSSIIKIRNRRR